MFFGLTFEKLVLIGVIAAVIIGPERLPQLAAGFARTVQKAGEYVKGAKTKMREEMGPEIDELDWRKLDPRQYDPRRIIRDALLDAPPAAPAPAAIAPAAPTALNTGGPALNGEIPPYDREAT